MKQNINWLKVIAYSLYSVFAAVVFTIAIAHSAEPKLDLMKKRSVVDNCFVKSVFDGDTFRCIAPDLTEYKVRLRAADTPEISFGKKECYGIEARDYLRNRINKREVKLIFEGGTTFDRVVAWTYDDLGMINADLISHGYARSATDRFKTEKYHPVFFFTLEAIAIENNYGGWGSDCKEEFKNWAWKKATDKNRYREIMERE